MIIDAHQHVFWHGRDDAGLVADMDEHGIDLAWLLTWETPPEEDNPGYHGVLTPTAMRPDGTHAGLVLADAVAVRDRYPDRFVLGYCPHPLHGDAPRLLEAAHRIHGARVCGEWKCRVLLDDPRCINLFRKAGELRMPVVIHIDIPLLAKADGSREYQPLWYGGTIVNLERALQACPDTIFIGHGPGFWREISGDADAATEHYPKGPVTPGGRIQQLLDRFPNLCADLSAGSGLGALKRDTPHAVGFLARYAERLLFGRDNYGGDLNQFLQTLDLPQHVADKLYSGNAQRLVPTGAIA